MRRRKKEERERSCNVCPTTAFDSLPLSLFLSLSFSLRIVRHSLCVCTYIRMCVCVCVWICPSRTSLLCSEEELSKQTSHPHRPPLCVSVCVCVCLSSPHTHTHAHSTALFRLSSPSHSIILSLSLSLSRVVSPLYLLLAGAALDAG